MPGKCYHRSHFALVLFN